MRAAQAIRAPSNKGLHLHEENSAANPRTEMVARGALQQCQPIAAASLGAVEQRGQVNFGSPLKSRHSTAESKTEQGVRRPCWK